MLRSLVGIVLTSLLSSLIVLGAPSNGSYPLPMKLTGSAVYTHDPSIIYAEKLGYYYVFSTHGGVARSKALKGFVSYLRRRTGNLGLCGYDQTVDCYWVFPSYGLLCDNCSKLNLLLGGYSFITTLTSGGLCRMLAIVVSEFAYIY